MGQRGRPRKPRCANCERILSAERDASGYTVCEACGTCNGELKPQPQIAETVERPIPAPLSRGDELLVLVLEELRAIRRGLGVQR